MHPMNPCAGLTAEPLLKVDHLVSLAEWLYCNGFPLKDAEDQVRSRLYLGLALL